MKALVFAFLLVCQSNIIACDKNEMEDWLIGTWTERNSSCPATLAFTDSGLVTITIGGLVSRGTFSISKAVGIPKNSICWHHQCYQVGYEIVETEKRKGCGGVFEIGNHDPYLNNFYRNSRGDLIWGESIVFVREN